MEPDATVSPHPALAIMRDALDTALRDCLGFSMLDDDGHVHCLDGDINTADVAASMVEELFGAGWSLVRIPQ